MTNEAITDYEILDAMETYGGDFIKKFASAYRHSDPENAQLLRPVFDKYRSAYEKASKDNSMNEVEPISDEELAEVREYLCPPGHDAILRRTTGDMSVHRIIARLMAAEAKRDSYKMAIEYCIDRAKGRETEWGDRAVDAFQFLYNALEENNND